MERRQIYKRYYDRQVSSEDIPRTTKFRKKENCDEVESENLLLINLSTEKSQTFNEQEEHLYLIPARNWQSFSNDIIIENKLEQYHVNLSSNELNEENKETEKDTGEETEEDETEYKSIDDTRLPHEDFEDVCGMNFDESSDEDQSVIDADDFGREGCHGENVPGDSYLNEIPSINNTLTRGEILLMILTLAVRHSLTWTAIIDLLKMINKLFNRRDAVPETKYKLLQYIPIEMNSMRYHFYCRNCKTYLGERTKVEANNSMICTCGSVFSEWKSSYFLSLDFKSQIEKLLQNREVQKNLEYRFRRTANENCFKDIYDGIMYKKLCNCDGLLSTRWNLSYTFNTDGC